MLPRSEGRARDDKAPPTSPGQVDGLDILDTRDFELDKIVSEGVAEIDIRMVGIYFLIWLLAGEHTEKGVVLMESLARVVYKIVWWFIVAEWLGIVHGVW